MSHASRLSKGLEQSAGLRGSQGARRQPARRSRRVRVDLLVEDLRSRMSARSALFTARSFGNAFATFGSRTTTFVASATRSAYFPRARRPKSERLYSGRRPSDRFLFAFLIDFPLAYGRGSSTDDLIVSPRAVWATTSSRPLVEIPNVTNRSSSNEWSGSGPVADSGSRNTVAASSNETPCLATLSAALARCHSNRTQSSRLSPFRCGP
jgi:hypothetical protein